MTHPASCTDPTCELDYRAHLVGIGISPAATPSRAVTRNPGSVDEPSTVTRAREKRMVKDLPAFKSLREQGYRPRGVAGCDRLAATARTAAEIEGRPG